MLHTRVCDILGIEYPIIQSPMNYITTPQLVAAVSNAGGLGICAYNPGKQLGVNEAQPEKLAEQVLQEVREIKRLTNKPFGVNIVTVTRPTGVPPYEAIMEIVLSEGVPVVYSSLGSPEPIVKRLHAAGVKLMHIGTTVHHAKKAEEAGVDIFVCAGYEAGGHSPGRGDTTLFTLLPQAVDAVKIPVVAGCGVADARGFVAALALGAEGVCMGTRFLATYESRPSLKAKQAVVDANDTATVAWGTKIGRGLGRTLKNRFTQKYIEMEMSGASPQELQAFIRSYQDPSGKVFERREGAYFMADMEWGEMYMGAVAGLVREIKHAEDVVKEIAAGAEQVLARLNADPLPTRP
ncbi:MAG: nitronate monooxygenase [Chloroflexi bacterium]|nr:nitronate monooxygenase [Chloroflexota bacterium]